MQDSQRYVTPQQVKKDLKWWKLFLRDFNGCSMMWLPQHTTVNQVFMTDSSLTGMGGICGNRFFCVKIPEWMQKDPHLNIAHFEMLAIVIALKTWKDVVRCRKVAIGCDNQGVLAIINSGKSRDGKLQD